MVTAKGIVFFVSAASALVLPIKRDASTILSDISTIDSDVKTLTSDANSYTGGLLGAVPIASAESTLDSGKLSLLSTLNNIHKNSHKSLQQTSRKELPMPKPPRNCHQQTLLPSSTPFPA
jgi:hypothetical protein